MSIRVFRLKKEHIALLRATNWTLGDNSEIKTTLESNNNPFGFETEIQDMGMIVYGVRDDFDPYESEPIAYTEDEINFLTSLKNELPVALEVIMNTMSFKTGTYKTKWHLKDWKLITDKNDIHY